MFKGFCPWSLLGDQDPISQIEGELRYYNAFLHAKLISISQLRVSILFFFNNPCQYGKNVINNKRNILLSEALET